jgi:hypothetical protein
MPDTPTSAEPSPEWLKLMAGLIRSGSFIAREEREKIAAALSLLAQVEQERDASDAVHERLRQAAHKLALYSMPPSDLTLSMSWGIEHRKRQDELDAALGAFCVDFDERHKRSRQPETPATPSTDEEVRAWCAGIYREVGVSPELRAAYEFYKANYRGETPERAGERPGAREALERIANATTFFAQLTVQQTKECALASATVEVARAALSSPSPDTSGDRGGWRPIDKDTPRDRPIQVVCAGYVAIMEWREYRWVYSNGHAYTLPRPDEQPTLWQYLPEPPR